MVEEMTETQFVLRLPDKLAKELRALMNKRKADPALDAKEKAQPCFQIKAHDKDKLIFRMGGNDYAAALLDLPCVVETHKTVNKETFYKSGDIGQMLKVDDNPIPSSAESYLKLDWSKVYVPLDSGLSAPTHKIKQRMWKRSAWDPLTKKPGCPLRDSDAAECTCCVTKEKLERLDLQLSGKCKTEVERWKPYMEHWDWDEKGHCKPPLSAEGTLLQVVDPASTSQQLKKKREKSSTKSSRAQSQRSSPMFSRYGSARSSLNASGMVSPVASGATSGAVSPSIREFAELAFKM